MARRPRKADPIAEVRKIKDPLSRAKLASQTITESQQVEIELARLRREAIEEAAANGITYAAIADAIGLSRGRVSQIRSDGPPLERVIFGVGPLDVGLPLRPIEGRALPVVASEDIEARDRLIELLAELGFVVNRVEIDPRRDWQPEAPDLIAICGPKSSPTIIDVLETDPALDFSLRSDGRWTIKDQVTDIEYASPMDDPTPLPRDIAYVGRLRFDSDRHLLLIAGVHAIGSLGAVHHLRANLAGLYRDVGTGEFSMVIASDHNDAGEIKATEVLCAPVLH